MATMARLIRAVLRLVLLNKAARYALIALMLKIGKSIIKPSTISRIRSFSTGLGGKMATSGRSGLFSSLLRGAAELLLLIFAKRGGFTSAGFLSALAAVLLSMSREQEEQGRYEAGKRESDPVIDLDDYTIVEDNH